MPCSSGDFFITPRRPNQSFNGFLKWGENRLKHDLTAMTLSTDRGAALAQLGEIFYGGVFLSKYNSLEKFHLVTANFLGHSLSLIFKIPQTYRIMVNAP